MSKEYEIYDMREPLTQEPKKIYAESPLKAVQLCGYKEVIRTTDKDAPLLVRGQKASYLYYGEPENKIYFGEDNMCYADMDVVTEGIRDTLNKCLVLYLCKEIMPELLTEKLVLDIFNKEK